MNPFDLFFGRWRVLLTIMMVLGLVGCRNPAQSSLPPSAISPPGTPVPILAQGDVYTDETDLPPETTIRSGDLLEVVIRRGSGEEQFTTRVSKTGWARVSFLDIQVHGLIASQASARIQVEVEPFMRNPFVQVRIKRDKLKLKRVFVFGDVLKPGMYPMNRDMTVMEAVVAASSYKETALLDEIRVIRGNLDRAEVLTADLARLFTYGDGSRNLVLRENDVVYVPREPLGDAAEAARKLQPIVSIALAPFQAVLFGKVLSSP